MEKGENEGGTRLRFTVDSDTSGGMPYDGQPAIVDETAPEEIRVDGLDDLKLNLWSTFQAQVEKQPTGTVYRMGELGGWMEFTWREYRDKALRFAQSLLAIGFQPKEAVLIGCRNSIDVCCANMGIIAAGGVIVHYRMDYRVEQLQFMAQDCNATIFIVQDIEHMLKILQVPLHVPDQIKAVIVLDNSMQEPPECSFGVYNLTDFLAIPAKNIVDTVARISAVSSTDVCVLAYHYSTMGHLRGVQLSHENICFTAKTLSRDLAPWTSEDKMLGYMPLFHVTVQILEIYLPLFCPGVVYFVSNPAEPLSESLMYVKPTIFAASPATWEQMSSKLFREKSRISTSRGVFYKWAKSRAKSNSRKLQYGSGKNASSIGHSLANHLVLRSIKKELGLWKCRACYAILAPLELNILEAFNAADIPIYQIFGSPETTGVATLNGPHAWMFGSYGHTLKGTQLHVNPISGEVYFRGKNVFVGYLREPETTASKIDGAGWYHSSLMGLLNPDGFLLITEHLNNYITLSTGDLVPPIPYERALKSDMPELKRAVVVGDARKYLIVLFILRVSKSSGTDRLSRDVIFKSRDIGSSATSVREVIKCPYWAVRFDRALERLNDNAELASHKIRKWAVMPNDFSIEEGEIDPHTKDPRRAFIQRKFRSQLDTLY